jgi:hypothetical protein
MPERQRKTIMLQKKKKIKKIKTAGKLGKIETNARTRKRIKNMPKDTALAAALVDDPDVGAAGLRAAAAGASRVPARADCYIVTTHMTTIINNTLIVNNFIFNIK